MRIEVPVENVPPDAEWDTTIIAVARATARRFPMVDWEDVAQELRLWWIATPRVARYLKEIEAEEEAGKVSAKKLMRALHLEASGFCQREKAQALGYRVDDLFFYSTGALREVLPMVFEYDSWLTLAQRGAEDGGGGRSPGAPAEGYALVSTLADVSRAVDRLRPADQDLIHQLYRDGVDEDALADELGVGLEALRKRHDRVLIRLRDILGGEKPPQHEGPGARRVMSRAAALAQTGAEQ